MCNSAASGETSELGAKADQNDRENEEQRRYDRHAVKVAFHDCGAGHGTTHTPTEHVRKTTATPRVKQNEDDEEQAGDDRKDRVNGVDHGQE